MMARAQATGGVGVIDALATGAGLQVAGAGLDAAVPLAGFRRHGGCRQDGKESLKGTSRCVM